MLQTKELKKNYYINLQITPGTALLFKSSFDCNIYILNFLEALVDIMHRSVIDKFIL